MEISLDIDVLRLLMPNPITMITQLIATAILFYALYKLAWTPVKKILDARGDVIQSSLTSAAKAQEEADVHLSEAKKHLQEAKQTSVDIVNSARDEANRLKETIVSQAEREAQEKMDNADRRIALHEQEVQNQVHDEMVNVAMAAVAKLLSEKATSSDDNAAIERFVNEANSKS